MTADDAGATACLDAVPNDCSLRGAITTANAVPMPDPVTIEVPAGDYALTIAGAFENLNQTGDLDVLRSMTIQGENVVLTDVGGGGMGGLADRLIEAHGSGTVLEVRDLTFKQSVPPNGLHAVTIAPEAAGRFVRVYIETSGSVTDGGGGLFVGLGATASLTDSRVWFNAGLEGAGILVQDGSLVITDSEIRNNIADSRGGGIAILDSAVGPVDVVNVTGSHFMENSSGDGGAVWAGVDTEVRFTDTFFEDNEVTIGPSRLGGAIYSQGDVVLDRSTITGGLANNGVAIYAADLGGGPPTVDLVNSTISSTSTDPGVGAITLSAANAELLHVTMVDNSVDVFASQSSMQTTGSLFEGGCLLVIGSTAQSEGTNLGLDSSCWQGAPSAGDMVVADLLLGPLDPAPGPTPTHLPDAASPAVDHVPGPCLRADQRGRLRPATGCDSGSVERTPIDIFSDGFESGDISAWSGSVP